MNCVSVSASTRVCTSVLAWGLEAGFCGAVTMSVCVHVSSSAVTHNGIAVFAWQLRQPGSVIQIDDDTWQDTPVSL